MSYKDSKGGQLDAAQTSGDSPPSKYYTTTDRDEAAWLCDKWKQPLSGKLAAATHVDDDPTAVRRLCDALGMWEFRRTQELEEGVAAYAGGGRSRQKALTQKRERREAAERKRYQKWVRHVERHSAWLNAQRANASPLSLEYEYESPDGSDPIEFHERLDEDHLVQPEEGKIGSVISSHPRYDEHLDNPVVVIAAVKWLYDHEYWGLLEKVGITLEDADIMDACSEDCTHGPLPAKEVIKKGVELIMLAVLRLRWLYLERTEIFAAA